MSIPIVFKKKGESEKSYIKRYTNILYDTLPQTSLEDREEYIEVRDKVIELNYKFFGFIVKRKFLNNSYADYEDKLQACIARFCTCWTWYKFEKKYRTDLSFTVFYMPRLGEMLERDFNEVQYSLRRTLCLEVGEQINKPWMKVTYDDLARKDLNISASHMTSLMAIFGTLYPASADEISPFLEAPDDIAKDKGPLSYLNDNYDDIINLLIREMIEKEKPLTQKDLMKMGEIYGLDPDDLKRKLPIAKDELYKILKSRTDS